MRRNTTDERGTLGTDARSRRNVVECQVCRCAAHVDEAIVLWDEEAVVFAVCHRCTRAHDIVMRPSGTGVQVLARSRTANDAAPELRRDATAAG